MGDTKSVNQNHKYASERFLPKVPACVKSSIKLLFNGTELIMEAGINEKRVYRYKADSGKQDVSGRFSYSIERQKIPFQGPIPEEEYWINPKEFWENDWYKFSSPYSGWGDYRITIHPYPKSKTYGRGGFFIHGGTERGSAGCIDLTTKIVQFYKDIHYELGENTNCSIELVVKYR